MSNARTAIEPGALGSETSGLLLIGRVLLRKLVELIESRVGSPQPHVANLAPWAMRQATEELGRPLTADQRQEVLRVLYRCWKYGLALRNWAVRQGYLEE